MLELATGGMTEFLAGEPRIIMKEKSSLKTCLLKLFVLLLHFVISAAQITDLECASNFTLYKFKEKISSRKEQSKSLCANIFLDEVIWEDADAFCKIAFSHLAPRIYSNSTLPTELGNKGIDLVWVGIRRRALFFVANSSTLFEEKKGIWGYAWSADEPLLYDCVALNVTSGSLLTQNCRSRLPFVCENDGISYTSASFPDLACPKNWKLSLPLAASGRKCVSSLYKARSQTDAEKVCEDQQARLATSKEYNVFLSSSNYLSAASIDAESPFHCPDGYSKLGGKNLCFKIYNEKRNWLDAHKKCSETSSYMINRLHISDIGSVDTFWLPYIYSNGKMHDLGMKSITELKNVTIENPIPKCVSATLGNNSSFKINLETCSKEISFACIKNTYELGNSYWVYNKGNKSCAYTLLRAPNVTFPNTDKEIDVIHGNCSKSLQFICVKNFELENVNIIVKQGSKRLKRYTIPIHLDNSSSCHLEDTLVCDVDIFDKNRLIFQWYKDDVPVSCSKSMCKIRFVSSVKKWSRYDNNDHDRQGAYHCEVRLAGLTKSYSSPKVNVLYPDIATYIIDIHGIDPNANRLIDYSHHKFQESMKTFNRTVFELLHNKFSVPAFWDFKSIRVLDGVGIMKISVFINRTDIAGFDNIVVYKTIKNIFETNKSFFKFQGNISLSINSADVCFSSEEQPNNACNGKITWPSTKQATDDVSNIRCLDDYNKPVYKECKSNFTSKAEWSAFNCSLCKKFYERFPESSFQCPDGYSKLGEKNLCFKIYNEKKNWYDAYKKCSETSSYMINHLHIGDIGSFDNFWLSYTYSYGKIQDIGMKPITELENVVIENPELHCVSAVLESNRYKLKLENCSKELLFTCIKNPYELVNSVKFSNTWTKLHNSDSCYNFSENTDTWIMAKSECQNTFHGADLLHGIQDTNTYNYLKWLLYQKFNNISCSTTWWMTFASVIKNRLGTNTTFFDWSPYINSNFKEQHESITLYPDRKIYWTLDEASLELKFICEIEKCEDNRPTQAYLENRTETEDISFGNYYSYLVSFKLKCVPSGWFVTNSMLWYKDGVQLPLKDELSVEFFFNIPPISSEITAQIALNYQGYYSCSVDQFFPIRTIHSTKHLFKIPEFYTYVLSMESQTETYIAECPKYMLNEKLSERTALNECFKNNINRAFDSFHFLVKNVTCNSASISITVHIYFKKESESEASIFKMIQEKDFWNFRQVCNVHSISLRSTVACYKETKVLKNAKVTWPTTHIGKIAYPQEMCLTDDGSFIERNCLGDFNSGAIWSELSVDKCSKVESKITKELYEMKDDVLKGSYRSLPALRILTSSPKRLQLADFHLIGEIFQNLAKQQSLDSEELGLIVETFSNLIDAPSKILNKATNLSNKIVEYFEQIASIADIEDKPVKIVTENVYLDIVPLTSGIDKISNCIILANGSTTLFVNASVGKLQNNENIDAGIVLPTNLLIENINASDRVVYSIYENLTHVKNIKVLSLIIHVALQKVSVYDLGKDEVTLFFKINKKIEKNSSTPKCVFWDYDLNSWSYKGCFPREINNNSVLCVCNHFTSFTIIMEMDDTLIAPHHQNILHFITYIGCSLSCIGFGLIIITFIIFREWRKFLKNKALFNYSISQFIFLFIFLTTIDKTCSKYLCKAAAISLHYFLLSSFAWMMALAYTVYLSLVKVLGTYVPRLMQKFIGFAWGMPFVIVIIVLSCNHEYYSREDYCWLSKDVIVYGIISPLAIMLITNFSIFGTIVYLNTCKKLCLRMNQDRRKLLAARTKAIICTSILLGLSWIFGFLAIGEAELIFQYIFSITTPLQGFLLAIFFVIRPKSTRDLWLKLFCPSSSSASSSLHSNSHIINSTTVSYKVQENLRLSKYENVINNVVHRAHSPCTPYK